VDLVVSPRYRIVAAELLAEIMGHRYSRVK